VRSQWLQEKRELEARSEFTNKEASFHYATQQETKL